MGERRTAARDNFPKPRALFLAIRRIERGLSFAVLILTEIRSIMVKYFWRILFYDKIEFIGIIT